MIKTIIGWLQAIRDYDGVCRGFAEIEIKLEKETILNNRLKNQIIELQSKKEQSDLEIYWNNRRKKVNKQWKARDGVNMDVRVFFQKNFNLPKFTGTDDEKAKKALGYVIAMVRYVGDTGEFWQYAYETMLARTGDCEDMGILVANILWNNDVPYWRIRLNKGWVSFNGAKTYHAWCTYLADDGEWYVLDAAYWPRESAGLKLQWKDAERYLSCDCSWNQKFSFGGLKK